MNLKMLKNLRNKRISKVRRYLLPIGTLVWSVSFYSQTVVSKASQPPVDEQTQAVITESDDSGITADEQAQIQVGQTNNGCDPNYAGACVPPYPPDVNCSDISASDFQSIGSDPHRLDRDKDGIACES